ncbi:bifunctional folylpolyglutamate synthase/dihydrofolate synthase [Heyndrickxia acidiproducens]|uniref:bifunctional folylpolyglutamate synthase/dihydrofolate synthase n=1 Tax=Heyndrickxia acidiproducens TaxID=1121084 RepID=UPI00035CDA2F|nr:folylpolyglutamate synthase/dihydrofolate synthase family protein [Heyndrickxia acidiproducens]
MIQTYEAAVDWIQSRLKFGIKPGLERMQWLMAKLNHPERRMKTIHVAGTNGKGSTVCYLRNILQQAGFTVGTFTSPYIEQFNERISINGIPVGDTELVLLVNRIRPLTEELEQTELGSPTEFEVITAMSLYYFADVHPVDFVIYEVGLGGRLDSTNVITPLISLITNIGHDHMKILGNTIAEIACEKAGIIKAGIPVITTAMQKEAVDVIKNKATVKQAPLYRIGDDFSVANHQPLANGEMFTLINQQQNIENLLISMNGQHQVYNAALAVMGALQLESRYQIPIGQEAIREGLKNSKWIGRFEQLIEKPRVIIDGAHNPEGIDSLIETMKTHLQGKKIRMVFSALGDKDLQHMIPKLDQVADSIVFTTFDFPRAIPAKALYNRSGHPHKSFSENWQAVLKQTMADINEDEVLVITGSLYFISQVRKWVFHTYA